MTELVPIERVIEDRLRVVASGTAHTCHPATEIDYDCTIEGVEPDSPFGRLSGGLACTLRDVALIECSASFFPSDLDGFEVASILGSSALCVGAECWSWFSGQSPSEALDGPPDWICDLGAECFAP